MSVLPLSCPKWGGEDGKDFTPGPVPVSYTHLDVYKRQADTCGAAGEQALSLLDEWEARQGDAERLRASVASIQSQLDDTIVDNRTLIGKLEQLKQTAPAQTAAALDTAIQRLQGANRTLEDVYKRQ